jgi:hypothetical protein
VTPNLLEAEDAFVEIDGFFEVIEAITGVEKFASNRFHFSKR